MKRTIAILAALLVTGGCTKLGGAGGPNGGRHPYTIPHVLRYATASDITGLNPYFSSELVVHLMAAMTMAWLWRYDAHNVPIPELATEVPSLQNGGISKDGLTITIHLRHGVVWADGVPFDSGDVIFSIGQVLNPANNVISRDGWDKIVSYKAPDKYTVVIRLKEAVSTFISTYFSTGGANPCILPQHLLKGLPDLNHVPYNGLPVGIGPFKYTQWKRSDSVIMEANDKYWRGRPKLDKIIYKLIPDRNTTLAQLKTHEIDMYGLLAPGFVAEASAVDGTTTLRQPSYGYAHIDFNITHADVADPIVRQALRVGTDRNEILQKVYLGVGSLQESQLSPVHPMHPDMPFVALDQAKAKQMLDADGWAPGSDGIRAKNGVRLVFNVASFAGSPDYDRLFELLRAMWKPLGVDLDIHHYLPSKMFDTYQNGGILYAGKYDVTSFIWYSTAGGDPDNLYGCTKFPPNGQNSLHYCNKSVVEPAIARFKNSYDTDVQRAQESIILHQIAKDVPTFVLAARQDVYVFNSDLKNFHPHQVSPFDDMMDTDI